MKTMLPGTATPLRWERPGWDEDDVTGTVLGWATSATRVPPELRPVPNHGATLAPGGGYPLWPATIAGTGLAELHRYLGDRALVELRPETVDTYWPWHRGADRPGSAW